MSMKPLRPIETPKSKLNFWFGYVERTMGYQMSERKHIKDEMTHMIFGGKIQRVVKRLLTLKKPRKKHPYSFYSGRGNEIRDIASNHNNFVKQNGHLIYNKKWDIILDNSDKGVVLTKTPYSILLEVIRLNGDDYMKYVPESWEDEFSDSNMNFFDKLDELNSLDLGNSLDVLKSVSNFTNTVN